MTTADTTKERTASLLAYFRQDATVYDAWTEACASHHYGERVDVAVLYRDCSLLMVEYCSDVEAFKRETRKRHAGRGVYKMGHGIALACDNGVIEVFEAEQLGRGLYVWTGEYWTESVPPQPNQAVAYDATYRVAVSHLMKRDRPQRPTKTPGAATLSTPVRGLVDAELERNPDIRTPDLRKHVRSQLGAKLTPTALKLANYADEWRRRRNT